MDDSSLQNVLSLADKGAKQRRPEWYAGLALSDRGTPVKGIANTAHVLSRHPAWAGVLGYDLFAEAVVKLRPPPVRPQDGEAEMGEWSDLDTTRTAAWFQSAVGFEPMPAHVDAAVAVAASSNSVHPVREYLRSVHWDGTQRLDAMLAAYFACQDSAYTRAVGSRWMISAVARVMRPGCQADSLLVLEGPQGAGKSTALEALASRQWFTDTALDIGNKDALQALRSKWVVELGELDSIRGREVTKVKAFLSARSDDYRPTYARRTRTFPRQCVFAGSTNEAEYLADKTGNRRFWPVTCGPCIDVDGLRRDRDQLWAEAAARFNAGEAWHLDTPELRAVADEEQTERQIDDPWVQVLEGWVESGRRKRLPSGELGLDAFADDEGLTTSDVMLHAFGVDAAHLSRAAATRAGQALRDLGWTPRQKREGGERVRRYHPPTSQPSQPVTTNDLGWL